MVPHSRLLNWPLFWYVICSNTNRHGSDFQTRSTIETKILF